MPAPSSIAAPEKEVRFTRSAQGRVWIILAALLLSLAIGVVVLATQGTEFEPPRLQGYLWCAVFPLMAAWFTFRLALRCVRHAYLIFTPLGLEIFPLIRPETSMQLLLWSDIHSLEYDGPRARLLIHYTAEKSAGVIVSLTPIVPAQRDLLRVLVESHARRHREPVPTSS